MKITTEPVESRQIHLTIEVDEERTQQAMRQAARQIANKVNIPGFRKGKAPYNLIVQRLGEDTIRQEASQALVEAVYREAIEQEKIEPYATGTLDEATLHPITFRFTIPLRPTVELGDYRNYRLKPPKVRLDKKQVQRTLEEIRKQNAILETVDRPLAMGDGVVLALVGRTTAGDEFLKDDEAHLLLEGENAGLIPGFAEAIVGMNADEERTFALTLPDNFAQETLRGQEAEFTVRLTEVYASTLPKLDDDLARTVGNFDSLKALKAHIEGQLRQAAQEKADEEYANKVLQAILEQSRVGYPPVMLKEEVDEATKEFEQAVKREMRLSLDDYLHLRNKTVETLQEELEPRAANRLKTALVLSEVTRLEGLEVGEEEVNAGIEAASSPFGVRASDVRTSLNSEAGRQMVRSRLLGSKAAQRLVAIAKGEVEKQEAESKGAEEQELALSARPEQSRREAEGSGGAEKQAEEQE